MALLRKIFFYLFVVIYLIFCPVTVLYALGYIFRPGEENQIVKTGLIYLASIPTGASVTIDGKPHSDKTPCILRDLTPGTYHIELKLEGRQGWSEDLPVEASKATVLEKIVLLPNRLESEKIADGPFGDLVAAGDGHWVVLGKDRAAAQALAIDRKTGKSTPLLPDLNAVRGAKITDMRVRPKSPLVLIRLEDKEGPRWLWADPAEPRASDITRLFPEPPERVDWDPKDRDTLFFFRDGVLTRLDLGGKKVRRKTYLHVHGFGLLDRRVYILDDQNRIYHMDKEPGSGEPILTDAALGDSLFDPSHFYEIRPLRKNLLLFLGEHGELLASRLPYRFVREGVEGAEWDADSERLLVWRKDKIGILDFKRQSFRGDVFEKGPQFVWVFKSGRGIEQAYWAYGGTHILFRDQNKVYLLDMETYSKPRLYQLVETKRDSSVSYDESQGRLVYIDADANALWSLEVVPRKQFLLLPFPDRKEEKKESEIQEL